MLEDGTISLSLALTVFVVTGVLAFFFGLFFRRGPEPETPREASRRAAARPRVKGGGLLRGLDALVDDPSLNGVDALLVALDVDDGTVDTHLAVGALLRRRGETDKAIRLHQNLLARPRLQREQRAQAEFELARDQLAAGRLDRAGRMLRDIAERRGPLHEAALEALREVHERARDWPDVIEVAGRLVELGHDDLRRDTAQAWCELAEQALDAGDAAGARGQLEQALAWDEGCVRASLALGRLEGDAGRWRQAVRHLERIHDQDPRYVTEALPALVRAHRELGAERDLSRLLERWQGTQPSTAVACVLAELVAARTGEDAARARLAEAVAEHPTARGLVALLEREAAAAGEAVGLAAPLARIRAFAEALVAQAPPFACDECGHASEVLHWQCPACDAWGTTAPVRGFTGD